MEEPAMDDLEIGPIDYLVVRFPGSKMTGEGLPMLVDLADRGIIRILDLGMVSRRADGTAVLMSVADFDGDGTLDLAVFEGAESGLLDAEDTESVAALVEPGDSAAVVVYENTWAAPFVGALRRGGAEVVSTGRIPAGSVLDALDSLEARESAGAGN
jgi:hypothetical protein